MNNPIKIRIVFMGSSSFAKTILEGLIRDEYNIIGAYTQPQKKVGRKQEIKKTDVHSLAEKKGIPVFEPEKFDEKTIDELKKLKPDLIVVAAYGKILPEEVLSIPGFGAINVHGSILPKFRGPSPVQNVILEGEAETGATIMLMDQGIDTGDILSQKKVSVSPDEIFPELMEKIAKLSTELLLETIPLWIERKIEPKKQDEKEATLCQLIERSDGKIFWSDDAESIYNRYRAFLPWPGIFSFWQQNDYSWRLKLNKISLLRNNPEASHHIGEVFQIGDKIGVQTVKGIIILEEIQLEGKNNMQIKDFINGNPNFIGSILK